MQEYQADIGDGDHVNLDNDSPFSIRGYVLAMREKCITKCWPFSHQRLQESIQEGKNPLLPPFLPPPGPVCLKWHHADLTKEFMIEGANQHIQVQIDLGRPDSEADQHSCTMITDTSLGAGSEDKKKHLSITDGLCREIKSHVSKDDSTSYGPLKQSQEWIQTFNRPKPKSIQEIKNSMSMEICDHCFKSTAIPISNDSHYICDTCVDQHHFPATSKPCNLKVDSETQSHACTLPEEDSSKVKVYNSKTSQDVNSNGITPKPVEVEKKVYAIAKSDENIQHTLSSLDRPNEDGQDKSYGKDREDNICEEEISSGTCTSDVQTVELSLDACSSAQYVDTTTVHQKCPVCLLFKSLSNTALNAHIDHCLAFAHGEELKPKLQKTKARKKRSLAEICLLSPSCNISSNENCNLLEISGRKKFQRSIPRRRQTSSSQAKAFKLLQVQKKSNVRDSQQTIGAPPQMIESQEGVQRRKSSSHVLNCNQKKRMVKKKGLSKKHPFENHKNIITKAKASKSKENVPLKPVRRKFRKNKTAKSNTKSPGVVAPSAYKQVTCPIESNTENFEVQADVNDITDHQNINSVNKKNVDNVPDLPLAIVEHPRRDWNEEFGSIHEQGATYEFEGALGQAFCLGSKKRINCKGYKLSNEGDTRASNPATFQSLPLHSNTVVASQEGIFESTGVPLSQPPAYAQRSCNLSDHVRETQTAPEQQAMNANFQKSLELILLPSMTVDHNVLQREDMICHVNQREEKYLENKSSIANPLQLSSYMPLNFVEALHAARLGNLPTTQYSSMDRALSTVDSLLSHSRTYSNEPQSSLGQVLQSSNSMQRMPVQVECFSQTVPPWMESAIKDTAKDCHLSLCSQSESTLPRKNEVQTGASVFNSANKPVLRLMGKTMVVGSAMGQPSQDDVHKQLCGGPDSGCIDVTKRVRPNGNATQHLKRPCIGYEQLLRTQTGYQSFLQHMEISRGNEDQKLNGARLLSPTMQLHNFRKETSNATRQCVSAHNHHVLLEGRNDYPIDVSEKKVTAQSQYSGSMCNPSYVSLLQKTFQPDSSAQRYPSSEYLNNYRSYGSHQSVLQTLCINSGRLDGPESVLMKMNEPAVPCCSTYVDKNLNVVDLVMIDDERDSLVAKDKPMPRLFGQELNPGATYKRPSSDTSHSLEHYVQSISSRPGASLGRSEMATANTFFPTELGGMLSSEHLALNIGNSTQITAQQDIANTGNRSRKKRSETSVQFPGTIKCQKIIEGSSPNLISKDTQQKYKASVPDVSNRGCCMMELPETLSRKHNVNMSPVGMNVGKCSVNMNPAEVDLQDYSQFMSTPLSNKFETNNYFGRDANQREIQVLSDSCPGRVLHVNTSLTSNAGISSSISATSIPDMQMVRKGNDYHSMLSDIPNKNIGWFVDNIKNPVYTAETSSNLAKVWPGLRQQCCPDRASKNQWTKSFKTVRNILVGNEKIYIPDTGANEGPYILGSIRRMG